MHRNRIRAEVVACNTALPDNMHVLNVVVPAAMIARLPYPDVLVVKPTARPLCRRQFRQCAQAGTVVPTRLARILPIHLRKASCCGRVGNAAALAIDTIRSQLRTARRAVEALGNAHETAKARPAAGTEGGHEGPSKVGTANR